MIWPCVVSVLTVRDSHVFDAWLKVATQKMCHPMPNHFNMVAENVLAGERLVTM